MDREQLLSGLKLRNELEQNIEQFKNIVNDLQKNEHTMYFRGVKIDFLHEIYKHYDEKDILNADGDIFYITEKKREDESVIYKGSRILWNMSLSKEDYIIHEYELADSDGNYDYTDYEVELAK